MKVAAIIDLRNPGKHICLRFRFCRFGLVSSDSVEIVFEVLIVNFALVTDITQIFCYVPNVCFDRFQ
jgi:hypothetical protein